MPITLGILAQSRQAPLVASDFVLLETALVGSGGAASVTFSNVNTNYGSTYKHLQIRATIRNDNANDWSEFFLRFNSDSANNYARHWLGGTGSTTFSGASDNQSFIQSEGGAVGGGAAANIFSATVIDILDPFVTTKNKTVRLFSGRETGTAERRIILSSGLWMNTAAVTTILIDQAFGNNFVEGSRFSLYGVK